MCLPSNQFLGDVHYLYRFDQGNIWDVEKSSDAQYNTQELAENFDYPAELIVSQQQYQSGAGTSVKAMPMDGYKEGGMTFQTLQIPKETGLSTELPRHGRDHTVYGERFVVQASADGVANPSLVSGLLVSINYVGNELVN